MRIALDHLASVYDIMTRLQALPIDPIKLDATVTGAGVDAARTEAMCQAVLDICRRIGLSVIAQGIATARRVVALQGMRCELGQGDLYGLPLRLPVRELEVCIAAALTYRRTRNIGSAARKNG